MAFIPIPNVAQVQVMCRIDGQRTINDLYFQSTSPPITVPDLQTLAAGVGSWFATGPLTLLSASLIFERVHVRDLTTQVGFAVEDSSNAGEGGVAGDFLPNNVAPCITIRSALSGRSGRGRNYLPGIPQTVVTGNTILSSFATDMTIAYQGLITGGGFAIPGWDWVVASRFSGNNPRNPGIAVTVVGVGFTDLTVDSQRRRLPGRGS